MPNEELLSYIKQCRAHGMSDDSISQSLLDAGWAQHDLDQAFGHASLVSVVQSKPKRKHRIVKTGLVTLGTILGLVLLVIFLPAMLGLVVPDSRPENTADLALATLAIPTEQNAFSDGLMLGRLAQDQSSSIMVAYARGEQWDDLQIQALLARNENVLAMFAETLRKPYWQIPGYASPQVSTEVVPMSIWRTTSYLAIIQARQLAKEGRVDEAVPQLVRVAQLGHKIQMSQSDLITYLVGLVIQNLAVDALAELAPQIQDPAVEASARQALGALNADATNMLKTQYAYWLKTTEEMLDDHIPLLAKGAIRYRAYQNGYTFQPVKTANELARVVRTYFLSAQKPCDHIPREKQFVDASSPLLYYKLNGFGKEMVQSFSTPLDTTMKKTCETQMKTQTALEVLQ
jgi:hypothetical protein